MIRRLFLTGPIGCGKSTILEKALGENRHRCGGFLTRRYREPELRFCLESLDGSRSEPFLDFPGDQPRLDLEVFSRTGTALLEGEVLVLDEIGGMELLNEAFASALNRVLRSDTPILGVVKGDSAASAMIRRLGRQAEYEAAAERLRRYLEEDPDTLVYTCGQLDSQGPELAQAWVKEYVHD